MTETPHDCPFKDVVIPKQSPEEGLHMNTRVGRLEGVVETLTRDIQEVSKAVGAVGKQVGDLKDTFADSLSKNREDFNTQIEHVVDRLTSAHKPQWQTISSFVVLAITVLGMAGAVVGLILSGQSDNLKQLQVQVAASQMAEVTKAHDDGKTEAVREYTTLAIKELKRDNENTHGAMDISLQREMRLLNDTIVTRIVSLDEKLQHEFGKELLNLKELVAELKKWRLEHTEHSATSSASQEVKIENIQKLLDKLEARQYEHRITGTTHVTKE